MRAKHTALLLTAGFLLMPTLIWSQFPGTGGPGAGGPGGMRAMFNDPDQIFNMVSKGQEVIRVDQLDAFSRSMFDRFASRYGLTGNEISRDQFKSAFTRIREEAARGQLNFQGAPGGMPGAAPDRDRRMDDRFQRMDRDQDGVLSHEELSETLQGEREKYDANHDGKIDLTEYRAYVEARIGDGRPGSDTPRVAAETGADEERKRPTILRAGSLPRDFPWAVLDQQGDNDGQVGLYEWKNAGKRIAEFVPMDLNNDGFLTVEEYYRWRKQGEGPSAGPASVAGNFGGRGPGMTGIGMGGMPGAGRGPGGERGFGMMGAGGGMPSGMMGMPGGDRGGFAMSPVGGMPGGDRGFGRGMELTGRGFGGMPAMTPGAWGGPAMPGGDRGFGRGPGGDRGPYSVLTPGAYSPGGMPAPAPPAFPGAGMTPPMVMPGMGRERMGGDRGNFSGDRGGDRGARFGPPGGDRGDRNDGDRGGRPDRPRKDRDR